MRLPLAIAAATALVMVAQQPPAIEFSCPMDPEVRSKGPGKCPRCGMTLVPGIPEPNEYGMRVTFTPAKVPAGQPLTLEFRLSDPKTGKAVTGFEVVHEKLFHLFLVSQDLGWFQHVHPELEPGGVFRLQTQLPKPGVYRLLADCYPKGGTPQLLPRTFTTAGYIQPLEAGIPKLQPDLSPKHGENLDVELTLDPVTPIAGKKTMLFFHLTPADGLEPYLGAWGHMMAASADLVDTIHEHPFIAEGGPQMQFNVFFPRPAIYRVWVQFQRRGVVNTVSFTVPVSRLQ